MDDSNLLPSRVNNKLEMFLTSDGEHKQTKTKKKLWTMKPIFEKEELFRMSGVCTCETIDLSIAKTAFSIDMYRQT